MDAPAELLPPRPLNFGRGGKNRRGEERKKGRSGIEINERDKGKKEEVERVCDSTVHLCAYSVAHRQHYIPFDYIAMACNHRWAAFQLEVAALCCSFLFFPSEDEGGGTIFDPLSPPLSAAPSPSCIAHQLFSLSSFGRF